MSKGKSGNFAVQEVTFVQVGTKQDVKERIVEKGLSRDLAIKKCSKRNENEMCNLSDVFRAYKIVNLSKQA